MVKHHQGKLLTTPEEIRGDEWFLPTGNDYVSLPTVRPADGGIERFGILSMSLASLLEVCGPAPAEKNPGKEALLVPWMSVEGKKQSLKGKLSYRWLENFVPQFTYRDTENRLELKGTVFAPMGEKGFVYLLQVANLNSDRKLQVSLGLRGQWGDTLQTVFRSGRVFGHHRIYLDSWTQAPVFEVRAGAATLGWAVMSSASLDRCEVHPLGTGKKKVQPKDFSLPTGKVVRVDFSKDFELEPGASSNWALYVGVNREGDGARTCAIDLARQGHEKLLDRTLSWLRERLISLPSAPAEDRARLEEVCNRNAFFNRFFALGRSLDNEELTCVTSRSPCYYVSMAFWSRDSLLWSLPAVLSIDPATAREMVLNCFRRYARHAGIHALYVDGTILYPGFELDELCAFIIGLDVYLRHTSDRSLLDEPAVADGLKQLERSLSDHKHPQKSLYATFLCPSDDPASYPYLTYDNALVALSFDILSDWIERGWIHRNENAECYRMRAEGVGKAILEHLVIEGPFGPMFAWSGDPDQPGKVEVADEPPGSLALLAYYRLCAMDHPVFQNTLRWIHSSHNPYCYQDVEFPGVGCAHTEHPFVMGLFNDLLSGRSEQAKAILLKAPLDGGLACEAFDRVTGRVKAGAAFATCAGFLAFAMAKAFGGVKEGGGVG